jgi:hypothetical protein
VDFSIEADGVVTEFGNVWVAKVHSFKESTWSLDSDAMSALTLTTAEMMQPSFWSRKARKHGTVE